MEADDFVTKANLSQQVEALQTGAYTAVELMAAHLDRIHAYDQQGPTLNGLVRLNPHALSEAERADQLRQQGAPCGPLHGVTVLVKDNYLTHDMPTSAGSVQLAAFQPKHDAAQVQALRNAGAIVLGKTTLHELSSGITTHASLSGQTRNALNTRYNPGGSSGGSAVAVAAAFAPVALGTDTSGSIRIPASFQGLYGLRPTLGRFSTAGVIPLCPSFDTVGPIARTPYDLATILDVMILTTGYAPAHYVQNLCHSAVEPLRVGILQELHHNSDPQVAHMMNQALHTLQALHATLVPVSLPEVTTLLPRTNLSDVECAQALQQFFAATSAPLHSLKHLMEEGGYYHAQHALFQRRATPAAYAIEHNMRTAVSQLRSQLAQLMQSHKLDVLAYPSCSALPAPLGRAQTGSNGLLSAVSGHPALSMPVGISKDGCAIGMELLALPHHEQLLLNLAHTWHQRVHPAFYGTTFLPPLSQQTTEQRYVIHAGICSFQLRCLTELNQARLCFFYDAIQAPEKALALNLEIYEHNQWLALDTLYTPYKNGLAPYHYNLTLYTWQALREGRLRLRAFAQQAELGGDGVILETPR